MTQAPTADGIVSTRDQSPLAGGAAGSGALEADGGSAASPTYGRVAVSRVIEDRHGRAVRSRW